MENDYHQRMFEKPVSNEDLECAASQLGRMMDEMKNYPELSDRLLKIRRLLAKAAEAYASGDREKCDMFFGDLKRERAMLFCTAEKKKDL